MSEENLTPAPIVPPAQATAGEPNTPEAPVIPETDWKAEARKWETRAKENKTAADRLAEIEESNKTEAQKQTERMAELEKTAATAQVQALRYRYAAKHQISDEDAELFLTASDEVTIAKQADRFAARNAALTPPPAPGAYVPGEGRTPATPGIDDAIAEATRNRDFARAIALKEQRAAQQRPAR